MGKVDRLRAGGVDYALGHMQCWGIVSVPVRLYDDLDVLIERH
jgi:hypothetical protein